MHENLYVLLNSLAALPWLVLILAPRWRGTQALAATPLAPLAFAAVYVVFLVLTLVGQGEGSMASLAELRLSFERDEVLLLAWVHYLAFDMVVGLWEFRDSQRLGIPHALLVPCLLCTLMLGPVGLILYTAVRWFRAGRFAWELPPETA